MTQNPQPRPPAETMPKDRVEFLLSKKSPLRPNQKQRIKAELRHGIIVPTKHGKASRR